LDVLSLTNDPKGPVHLVLCSQLPESVDYVTLSYCWGKDPSFVKLLSTNLPALQTGIPLVQLPRTFRDAVRVTRRLGYQYLWIDALCIIQDSPQDCLQEALLMTKVYASSVLNIAAAASGDANGSLFRDREPDSLNGCDIPIAWENMDSYKGSNPVKKQIYHVFVKDPWSDMLFHSPLQTRGWAFQERLLSPRIVYFAHDQIYWECCDHCASELYPDKDIFQIHDIHNGRRRPVKENFANVRPDGDLNLSLDTWNELIEAYSRRDFTHSSDKLIALSGIAAQMTPALKPEDYLAGIWRQSLPESLLWRALPHAFPAPEYRAPSWSWASIDGPIARESFPVTHIVAEVLASKITGIAGPFGPITSGSLLMKGFFCEEGSIIFAKHPSMCTRKDSTCPWNRMGTSVDISLDIDQASSGDLEAVESTRNLFLFPVMSIELFARKMPLNWERHKFPHSIQGLVLEPVQSVKGRFCRVGHFFVLRRHSRSSVWQSFRSYIQSYPYFSLWIIPHLIAHAIYSLVWGHDSDKPLQEVFAKAKLQEQYYQDFDGVDQYTIEIV
jgi:Heterokaryon incompatibility protein (HET)